MAGTMYESNVAGHRMLCTHCWRTPGAHGPDGECLDREPPIVLSGEAAARAEAILRKRGKL